MVTRSLRWLRGVVTLRRSAMYPLYRHPPYSPPHPPKIHLNSKAARCQPSSASLLHWMPVEMRARQWQTNNERNFAKNQKPQTQNPRAQQLYWRTAEALYNLTSNNSASPPTVLLRFGANKRQGGPPHWDGGGQARSGGELQRHHPTRWRVSPRHTQTRDVSRPRTNTLTLTLTLTRGRE